MPHKKRPAAAGGGHDQKSSIKHGQTSNSKDEPPPQPIVFDLLPPFETPAVRRLRALHPQFGGRPIAFAAFRVTQGERTCNVGFGTHPADGPTLICDGVIERLIAEAPGRLCVRLITNPRTALQNTIDAVRGYRGAALLIAFADQQLYDAVMSEIYAAPHLYFNS